MAIQSMPEPRRPQGVAVPANEAAATSAGEKAGPAARQRRADPAEAAARIVAETTPEKLAERSAEKVQEKAPEKDGEKTPGRADGTLVIGREIEVRGEIGSCERLIVEGKLEASTSVGTLRVSEAGLFVGEAEVQQAEISGRFEGELEVHGELRLTPTARVEGRIRYGRIVIESGGEISGEISVLRKD